MLKIHQPYIKRNKFKHKYCTKFALASIGVLLLAFGLVLGFSPATHPVSRVYAAGDSRTLSDISTMQEMTQQICSNSDKGETNSLLDSRGGVNNYYQVMKMPDNTCWMAENLRLKGGTKITSSDSDVNSDYTLPTSGVNASTGAITWGSDNDNDTAYMADGTTNMKIFSGNSWKEAYGNYYSWCAATAMSCKRNRTGSAITSTDAAESICPKNWKLPKSNANTGSFQSLYANYPNSAANTYWLTSQTIPYNDGTSTGYNGKRFGINNTNALFPAAGLVNPNGLYSASINGYYWSRRAVSYATNAFILHFYSDTVYPQASNARYSGCSVRCVAEGGLDKIEKPLFSEEAEGNVNVVVPSALTIDATSGMAENADSSKITEGTATATVSSNTDYTVTLHSTQPSLKDPSVTTAEISPVSETNPVTPGNNSWGFWSNKTNADGSKIYDTPIITTPQEFYNTTSSSVTDNGNTTTHTYYVGISIAPSLPSGTYSTDVTITASVK